MNKWNESGKMRWLVAAPVAMLLAACASIGRPTGGDYDIDPPVFVSSNPAVGGTNFKGNKITLTFDENVQLQDVMNKVVVSPAQKNIPSVTANGKKVTVEIRDTMIPDMTYTIDFSDAIQDLNEANELDGFSIAFSTGDSIDSLQVSGMVFEARTLEPAQGMLVGVYSNLSDTAIRTLPLERIARTNQMGQFTIRGLHPGEYRIYAINDVNRDYHWDTSEDVAFYDVTISPSVNSDSHNDTIRLENGADSVIRHSETEYLPNDILLTWFNEGNFAQYLKDYERPDRNRLKIQLATKADSLPKITLLNGAQPDMDISTWAKLNTVPTLDTLEYFITDTTLIKQDTLMIAMGYNRTDANQQLTWGVDTLRILFKGAREEARKKEQAEKDWEKRVKRAEKKGEDIDSIKAEMEAEEAKKNALKITVQGGTTQDVYAPLRFKFVYPLDTIYLDKLHLEHQVDTLWDTIALPPIELVDSFSLMNYKMDFAWEPGGKYRFTADSGAVVDIYNNTNRQFNHELTVKQNEDYSPLYFAITGVTDSAIVEVLDKNDKPLASAPVINGETVFPYMQAGEYYARLYIDRNNNGEYDTGILDSIQPEEMFYCPKKIVLKKNWEVEQRWDIYETPIDLQKPKEIVKNKPKAKKRRRNKDGTYVDENGNEIIDEEEEDDGFNDENFFGPGSSNGKRNFGSGNMNSRF